MQKCVGFLYFEAKNFDNKGFSLKGAEAKATLLSRFRICYCKVDCFAYARNTLCAFGNDGEVKACVR